MNTVVKALHVVVETWSAASVSVTGRRADRTTALSFAETKTYGYWSYSVCESTSKACSVSR